MIPLNILSAERENAKYLDSIEGRTQQMKSSFQDLANSLVDNSWIKGLITIGDEALKLFGAFDGALAKLVAAPVAIITAFGALKTIGKMDLFQKIGTAFKDIGRPNILGFIHRFLGMLPQIHPSICTHVSLNIQPISA